MSDLILAQNTKIEAAYKWLKLGASLLPHQPNSKFLISGFGPQRKAVRTRQQADFYFKTGDYNMGVLLPKNLWCLDFDDDALFSKWSDETPVSFQETYTEITPHGWHLFFRGDLAPGLRLIAGVEIKRAVLVAPSMVKGFVYRAVFSEDPIRGVGDPRAFLSFLLSDSPPPAGARPASSETVRPDRGGDDLISRIKARWSVKWLASSLTELKESPTGQDRWFIGRCPLHHPDEHPSFWVDDVANTWGCFVPACPGHQGGDLVNLYALANHIENGEAIKRLAWGLK